MRVGCSVYYIVGVYPHSNSWHFSYDIQIIITAKSERSFSMCLLLFFFLLLRNPILSLFFLYIYIFIYNFYLFKINETKCLYFISTVFVFVCEIPCDLRVFFFSGSPSQISGFFSYKCWANKKKNPLQKPKFIFFFEYLWFIDNVSCWFLFMLFTMLLYNTNVLSLLVFNFFRFYKHYRTG